jgi:hypothetical protein
MLALTADVHWDRCQHPLVTRLLMCVRVAGFAVRFDVRFQDLGSGLLVGAMLVGRKAAMDRVLWCCVVELGAPVLGRT